MLVRARHRVFGVCGVPDNYPRRYPDLWQLVEDDEPTGAPGPYDPTGHRLQPVDDDDGVLAYLAVATPDEVERVKVVELARTDREPRKTVLDWQPETPPGE